MTDKLATTDKEQHLATIPDDLRRDAGRGTENVGDDLKPPRILICQAGSPQRKPDDAKQIPGLNELDMFNDLSKENYGRGPLRFVVLTVLKPKGIEFNAMEDGGGVKDFDVPLNDPRMQWTTDENGQRQKPVATLFREFLVWLIEQNEPAVLSMKSSALKAADDLRRQLKLPIKGELIDPSLKGQIVSDPPAWARTFSLTTVMQRDTQRSYAWGNYALRIEGLTPTALRLMCSGLADVYAKKNIIIDREPGDEDSFVPADLESKSEM